MPMLLSGHGDFPNYPSGFCAQSNLSWKGTGEYARFGGKWWCFSNGARNWDDYDDALVTCRKEAISGGVPEDTQAAWCEGGPSNLDPGWFSPIFLVPAVLMLLAIGYVAYIYLS
jgi:hypothetical protein